MNKSIIFPCGATAAGVAFSFAVHKRLLLLLLIVVCCCHLLLKVHLHVGSHHVARDIDKASHIWDSLNNWIHCH